MAFLMLLFLLIGQYAAMEHPAHLPKSLVSPEPREGVAKYLPGNSPLTSPPIYSIDGMLDESAIEMPSLYEKSIIQPNEDSSIKEQTSESEETPAQGFDRLSRAYPDPAGSRAVALPMSVDTARNDQVAIQTTSREIGETAKGLLVLGGIVVVVGAVLALFVTIIWAILRRHDPHVVWVYPLTHAGRGFRRRGGRYY
ncbi:hypothetical protein PTTG_28975 [Puccinia triticina 1-1 BBBD Race 1]|uniref:Mid2 domain-containing protein n=2 Tax=Puccinia triticina TaxID=208348 RepID=A0A180G9N0_PUCT1|nr:uncharacterized protein PtA15_8A151 [Puccinia triticina]OAV88613.1 hypothetical protein PTTG_28975 [Puccinia triticina 1-1 BBBD Race 1]WAQ87248.1 hypothetical protein PtA15_8A151 [Puccinia triticina]WAR57100.1 hypothetical protein PtB15_8B146 [Puccinia triticina]